MIQDEGPLVKGDPFYESQENHNLIGVANIFLECLFHDVTLDYHVPIISQQGEVMLINYICKSLNREGEKKIIFIYKYNKVVNKNLSFVVDNNVILPLNWIQIAGKLHIQISKLGGSFLERYGDTNSEDSEDTEPVNTSGTPMIVRVCLKTEPSKNQPH